MGFKKMNAVRNATKFGRTRPLPKQLEGDRQTQQALIQAKPYSNQDRVHDQLYDHGVQFEGRYKAIVAEQLHLDSLAPDVQDAVMKISRIFHTPG